LPWIPPTVSLFLHGVRSESARLGARPDTSAAPLAPEMLDEWLDRSQQDGARLLEKVNAAAFDVAASWRLRPVRMVDRDGWPAAELDEAPIA